MTKRVRILTGYDDTFLPIANLTIPNLRAYADRHGHEFSAVADMDAHPCHPAWAKIPLIRNALAEGCEFIVWIDSDALIVRPDRDIGDNLSATADLQMAWHGPDTARIESPEFVPHYNAGVMVIRNTEWSRDFFARVWALCSSIGAPWFDQAGILTVLGYRECLGAGKDIENIPDRAHVARLDCMWNSIPGVIMADDPIIHHYAGLPNFERARLIEADIASLAEREVSAPLRKTISRQLSMWSQEVRQRTTDAARIATLLRTAHELEGAPRRLLKMLPRAISIRLRGYAR